jgi:hypothetical protein
LKRVVDGKFDPVVFVLIHGNAEVAGCDDDIERGKITLYVPPLSEQN